jgi:hypothetical protein
MVAELVTPLRISAAEFQERRYIARVLKGTINYCRSKMIGHTVAAQIEGYPAHLPMLYKVTLTIALDFSQPNIEVIGNKANAEGAI